VEDYGTAELHREIGGNLLEGPLWDPRSRRLIWVDIPAGRVQTLDGGTGRSWEFDGPVGTCFLTPDPEVLLVAAIDGIRRLDCASGAHERVADIPREEGVRYNDGKAGPDGRLWCGTMDLKGAEGRGGLARIDRDGSVRVLRRGDSIANGLAWSADGRRMYYVETASRTVWGYDYDPDTGEATAGSPVFEFPSDGPGPDGMTIDDEDRLWIAFWGGSCVRRCDPVVGEVLGELRIPAEQVTSCCFGGPDLDRLYVTTAAMGLDDDRRRAQPHAGSLFVARVPARGREEPVARLGGSGP